MSLRKKAVIIVVAVIVLATSYSGVEYFVANRDVFKAHS